MVDGVQFNYNPFLILCCGRFDVSDQVTTILLLLETGEHHLGARDVLLGVLQVNVQSLRVPLDPLLNVGRSVSEPGSLKSKNSC